VARWLWGCQPLLNQKGSLLSATDHLTITCQEKGRPDTFEAEVPTDCTANELLRSLVDDHGYLENSTGDFSYRLVVGRTGTEIPASTTLADAGVKDGEVLTITRDSHGAAGKEV
jgi:hypothetical protein